MREALLPGERRTGPMIPPFNRTNRPSRIIVLTPSYDELSAGSPSQRICGIMASSINIMQAKVVDATAGRCMTYLPIEFDGLLSRITAVDRDTLIVLNGPGILFRAIGVFDLVDKGRIKPTLFFTDGNRGTLCFTVQAKKVSFVAVANYLGDEYYKNGKSGLERHLELVATLVDLASAALHHGIPCIRHSAASTSFACWLSSCQEPTPIVHDNSKALELERAAFTAGWTEAFFHGLAPTAVDCWDIKSAYPHAAAILPLPQEMVFTADESDPYEFLNYAVGCGCSVVNLFASVQIRNSDIRYPVRINGETHYATGNFNTVLCGHELENAIKLGHCTHVFGGHGYRPGRYLSSYLKALLSDRQLAESRGLASIASACKLLANSVIGKFGQHGEFWEFTGEQVATSGWNSWSALPAGANSPIEFRAIGKHVQRHYTTPETATSFPALPAIINSAVRNRMLIICQAIAAACGGWHHIYHVATDAIHVTPTASIAIAGGLNLAGDLPGLLRHQWHAQKVDYYGPNTYDRDSQLQAPGLFKMAVRDGKEWSVQRISELAANLNNKDIGIIPVSTGRYTVYRKVPASRLRDDGFISPERLD